MKASGASSAGGARDARARGTRGLRREEILTAAAALFARRGFHGVTIDDIGAAAGLSGPGIYRHFPGKEAMLSEMLLGISQRLLAEGSRRAADAQDAAAALDALLRWHVGFALSQPDLITVQARELDNVPEPARRQIRRLQRLYVEEWVTVASELNPLVPPSRLRTAVHAMFGLLNSTPHSVSPHGASELPADTVADLLYAMARGALAAAAPAPAPAPVADEHAPAPAGKRLDGFRPAWHCAHHSTPAERVGQYGPPCSRATLMLQVRQSRRAARNDRGNSGPGGNKERRTRTKFPLLPEFP